VGDQNVERCSALEDLLQAGDTAVSRDPRALVLVHLRHGGASRRRVAGLRKQARIHRTIVMVGLLLSRPALGLASFTTTQVDDGIASGGPVTASGAMPESLAQRLAQQQFAGEALTVVGDVYHVLRGTVAFADPGRSALASDALTYASTCGSSASESAQGRRLRDQISRTRCGSRPCRCDRDRRLFDG
jgi:hypothetical protein